MSDHKHDQRDQKQQDAIIAPGHTLATITDKISEIVLTPPLKTPIGWHAMMGIGSIGVLRLQRSALTMTTMPNSDSSGASSLSIFVPGDASLVGTTQWYQGFHTSPRRLTSDWAQVTILP